LQKLPKHVRALARDAFKLFLSDPNHPSLDFKPVHPTQPIYSVRVTLDYRAIGVRDGSTIVWIWIGPHSEYDKLIDRM
ncbi:MAG: hypothetical protein AB1744_14005, partial [Candidatus Zixiibacteriota bacterium]